MLDLPDREDLHYIIAEDQERLRELRRFTMRTVVWSITPSTATKGVG